jgi:hypothetical protein
MRYTRDPEMVNVALACGAEPGQRYHGSSLTPALGDGKNTTVWNAFVLSLLEPYSVGRPNSNEKQITISSMMPCNY